MRLLWILFLVSCFATFTQAAELSLSADSCKGLKLPAGAQCGNLPVPENPQNPAGRTISIFVIRLPSLKKPAPSADAAFVLSGGPGQGAASGLIGSDGSEYKDLRQKRDVVFVDQRGTGRSHPLNCDLRGDSLAAYFNDLFPVDKLVGCRRQLEKDSDLTMYTSSLAADDLESVRTALNYRLIDLIGASYGAKAAFVFLRRHPNSVRSMALQSVSTVEFRLPLPFARAGQETLDHIFAECAAQEKCRHAFPELRKEFLRLVDLIKKAGVDFEMKNPATNQTEKIHMTYPVFAERLRQLLYVPEFVQMVPVLIHRAAAGDYQPFAQVGFLFASTIEKEVSFGMYFSVTCSEDLPFVTEETIRSETKNTFLDDTRIREHQKACAIWPRADVPSSFLNPVRSDVPVLMVSGEWDPATPPSFAKAAAHDLSHTAVVIIPKASHLTERACVQTLVTHFLDDPTPAHLNSSCVRDIPFPDFYTELPSDFLDL